MSGEDEDGTPKEPIERKTLCFSIPQPGVVLHIGEPRFRQRLGLLCPANESNAVEEAVKLKSRLKDAPSEEFWATATEGFATLLDAQYGFISKRILVDEENAAVEMPPIGEPGSCLMGQAFYYNDDKGTKGTAPMMRYAAYDCPCAYMRHDKVFIVPERLNEFVVDNPNAPKLIIPGEAYLGVPLFAEGKCVAHFGVMWGEAGAKRRNLSWPFLEMLLHSLEDVILARVLEGTSLEKFKSSVPTTSSVIPHEAITAAQSLKPYARSLSHELRTPMQGVVGMLDIMYATVQEATECQMDPRVRKIFETLKDNIETVQDSSRRAVEAADNVVHAVGMDMGFPNTPLSPLDEEELAADYAAEKVHKQQEKRPDIVVTGNTVPVNFRGVKRRRDSNIFVGGSAPKAQPRKAAKASRAQNAPEAITEEFASDVHRIPQKNWSTPDLESLARQAQAQRPNLLHFPASFSEPGVVPGLRHTNLRHVLQYVINDSLRVGGRPESAIAREVDGGEIIEVMTRTPSGREMLKTIHWSVDPNVPETIMIDEKDLAKMISCVFLNAVKFTEQGTIRLTARLSPRSRYVIIKVRDTGPGIPANFLPNLFKPFAREDDSITRQQEGLGLGLLVAKGIARKLRGDLLCVRADTSGQHHGSEFEMRVPATPGDANSRAGSPFSSPAPSISSVRSVRDNTLDSTANFTREPTDDPLQALPRTPPALITDTFRKDTIMQQHNRQVTTSPTTYTVDPRVVPNPSVVRASSPSINRRSSTCSLSANRRLSTKRSSNFDRQLAKKHPLTFLVVEDNKINRKLLVNMLSKLGYDTKTQVCEAYDGADAVRQYQKHPCIDVILMDLWMPFMDGYEATEKILGMAVVDPVVVEDGAGGDAVRDRYVVGSHERKVPTIMAVTADVTEAAMERAGSVGMKGVMCKPYNLSDLERLIVEYVDSRDRVH